LFERERRKAIEQYLLDPTQLLFDDTLQYLCRPLLNDGYQPWLREPGDYSTENWWAEPDRSEDEDPPVQVKVQAAATWGKPWITTTHKAQDGEISTFEWSLEGCRLLQYVVGWESLMSLGTRINERKLNEVAEQPIESRAEFFGNLLDAFWAPRKAVIKWMLTPAIRKRYIYDKRLGRSHELITHENDEPFSFHNCCLALGADEDILRDGVRRTIPLEIIQEIEDLVRYE
jgi:hypothetical protein